MSLLTDFLEQLSPEYAWQPAGNDIYLVTRYGNEEFPEPVRLFLDEALFDPYAQRVARTSEDGDLDAALGLIKIHLDEQLASSSDSPTFDVGLRRDRLGRPTWFTTRRPAIPPARPDGPPTAMWVADRAKP